MENSSFLVHFLKQHRSQTSLNPFPVVWLVFISRRNFNHNKEYTYTTLHWHHSALSSLCFTPEGKRPPNPSFLLQGSDFCFASDGECVWFLRPGTNLLSGGVESVLVQWKYRENQRDFLPRLGAAITHVAVSPDGALFCCSHSDNSKLFPPGDTSPYSLFTGFHR